MNTTLKRHFGRLTNGEDVVAYTLSNSNGMQVEILSYGGIITKLLVPDRERVHDNIVLGFTNLEEYLTKSPYFGAIVGRFANRISRGKFTLNNKEYTLATNNGKNHLHGGLRGLDKVNWTVEPKTTLKGSSLVLSYLSPDGEEGYPGNVHFKVSYTLTHENSLEVDFEAITDTPTIVNLTQHSYFNLAGKPNQQIYDHRLQINANHFLPVNKDMIPTGEFRAVQNTPFDFLEEKPIREVIDLDDAQLHLGSGFDHCYVLNNVVQGFRQVARVNHPTTGRTMEVFTSLPGMQLYTANHLATPFTKRTALCLETQHYPDSPNQNHFPSTELLPDEKYRSSTHFVFSVD
jgi:aldose 1-epimerase